MASMSILSRELKTQDFYAFVTAPLTISLVEDLAIARHFGLSLMGFISIVRGVVQNLYVV
jgi:hypothetical protein